MYIYIYIYSKVYIYSLSKVISDSGTMVPHISAI